jgi:hypothetical protein
MPNVSVQGDHVAKTSNLKAWSMFNLTLYYLMTDVGNYKVHVFIRAHGRPS